MTSPMAYWHVPDIEAKLAEETCAGATVKESAHDVGGGRLVATVTDLDGNVLGLIQDQERRPRSALSVVATLSIGSPTTSMSGWPVPRRTVCRIWYRCPSTGTARRCCWPRRRVARTGRTSPPPNCSAGAGLHPRRIDDRGRGRGPRDRRAAQQRGDRFAPRAPSWPASATPYGWFRISPRRIQAWREANELPDRELMRDGQWLA